MLYSHWTYKLFPGVIGVTKKRACFFYTLFDHSIVVQICSLASFYERSLILTYTYVHVHVRPQITQRAHQTGQAINYKSWSAF